MAIGSQGEIREALYGLLGGNSDAAKTLIDNFVQVKYKVDKPADAATSTSSAFCRWLTSLSPNSARTLDI